MVALINPEGRFPAPTKLETFSRKESLISEKVAEDSDQSDVPETLEYVKQQTIHQWLMSDTKAVHKPKPPREKLSSAAKRRASAADCKGSQRKIFDVVFEPVMAAINESMFARQAHVDKERAKLEV